MAARLPTQRAEGARQQSVRGSAPMPRLRPSPRRSSPASDRCPRGTKSPVQGLPQRPIQREGPPPHQELLAMLPRPRLPRGSGSVGSDVALVWTRQSSPTAPRPKPLAPTARLSLRNAGLLRQRAWSPPQRPTQWLVPVWTRRSARRTRPARLRLCPRTCWSVLEFPLEDGQRRSRREERLQTAWEAPRPPAAGRGQPALGSHPPRRRAPLLQKLLQAPWPGQQPGPWSAPATRLLRLEEVSVGPCQPPFRPCRSDCQARRQRCPGDRRPSAPGRCPALLWQCRVPQVRPPTVSQAPQSLHPNPPSRNGPASTSRRRRRPALRRGPRAVASTRAPWPPPPTKALPATQAF
mmetsp:Transcript_19637/g.75378  ORF Transcript_19637/g.75378 Transcript_19637/m.75378 type:complete len:350 (-) Transcript_19637:2641-3690(-)